jgi:hypothetical protein
VGADMTERTDADSVRFAVLDRDNGLQEYRGRSRSNRVAFYAPEIRPGRSGQTSGAGRQVRQGAMRPQERAPDYRVIAAWSAFLLSIGAGAFVVGMTIHNEAIAQQPKPRPEPIYYCVTGVEMPPYEPCKERKDRRDI